MAELKFVITGTAGVGKSTAIRVLSETVESLAQVGDASDLTIDCGKVLSDGDVCVRIYGAPGQSRFRPVWDILAEGALGLIILVDNTRPDPISDLSMYIHNFLSLINKTGVAVGVTRSEQPSNYNLEHYYSYLNDVGLACPVIAVDPRHWKDMIGLMDALIATLEYA